MAMTNEHPTTPNKILLQYLKNIVLDTTTAPTSGSTYWIGNAGLYFVKGLMSDPVNPFLTYLFATDKNVASGTFGVFKMDFTPLTLKYVYTPLTISSGLAFNVTSLFRISMTDANDFLFAGKTQSLTDGINTQTFVTSYGYVMKGRTSDSDKN